MRWLTNMRDPRLDDAIKRVITHMLEEFGKYETPEQAHQRELEYIEGRILGEPMATRKYSVVELKNMGLIGVYEDDENGEVVSNPIDTSKPDLFEEFQMFIKKNNTKCCPVVQR